MLLQIKDIDNIRIIELCPRINIHNVFDVEEQITGLIDADHKLIVIDFSKVEYFGSNGIRILMLARRKLDKLGGDMVLVELSQFVVKILKAIDLVDIFKIMDSKEEGINALRAGG